MASNSAAWSGAKPDQLAKRSRSSPPRLENRNPASLAGSSAGAPGS
jgi:hypothetical protein